MSKIEVKRVANLSGHKDAIYTLANATDGKHFFSAGGDGMVVRWNLNDPENGELIAKVPASIYALHYLEPGILLVGQNFEGLHAIDVALKKELRSVKLTASYIFDIKVYNNRIYVATGDGTLIMLELESFKILASVKLADKSARTIAVHPGNGNIAVGYSDNFIRVLDGNSLQLVTETEAHTNSVFTLAFTPDGKYLLSGSRDAHLKIWDVGQQYKLHQSIVAHLYTINDIAIHPEKMLFATCSMDKSIKIWDAEHFRLLKVIDKARHAGHGTSINKVVWPDSSTTLVSCSDDRTIGVWKMQPAVEQKQDL